MASADRDEEIDIPEPQRAERPVGGRRSMPRSRSQGRESNLARIFIGSGRQAGIRPADLVGAITGEAGIASSDLGAIEIADRFSLIEVPEEHADRIVIAMKKATLRGKRVQVRRDRESRA